MKLSVLLHNDGNVFYTGTTLTGSVVLNLPDPMEVRELTVVFVGKGHCYWEEHVSRDEDGRERTPIKHEGNEEYCQFEQNLHHVVLQNNRGTLYHPPGRYSYPFLFNLPVELPSSFEGQTGNIRYVIEAEAYLPRNLRPKVDKNVTIRQSIDSNLAQYKLGTGGEQEKTIGCWCCVQGTISINADIPRTCYCPGDIIHVNASVENHSTRDMECMAAKLYQKVVYRARGSIKEERKKVCEVKGARIVSEKVEKWKEKPLNVPALLPPTITSTIISVYYQLQFQVEVQCGINPRVEMPILIGTIPLRADDVGEDAAIPGGSEIPGGSGSGPTIPFVHEGVLYEPPPPYEESEMSDYYSFRPPRNVQPTAPLAPPKYAL